MSDWFEADDFWETLEDFFFSGIRTFEMATEEVDRIVRLLELGEKARVLDLACGPGRHALELARRGLRVTGVDRTERYLEQARGATHAEGLEVEWVQSDMRRFRRPAAFDAALSLFSSFGYFERAEDDRQVLENLHASLRPGGRLLIDLMSREILDRQFRPRHWHHHPASEAYLLEECRRLEDSDLVENRWIWIRGAERKTFSTRLRVYPAPRLEALLEEVGFSSIRLHGGLNGAPYDGDAERLVIVAEVP